MARSGTRKPGQTTPLGRFFFYSNDRPRSVRNRCAIEVFGGVLVLSIIVWNSVSIRAYVIGLSQISFFFFLHEFEQPRVRVVASFMYNIISTKTVNIWIGEL